MMALFDDVKSLKLKIQNYKSFGNEEQGFETLRAINVLVGRNNSGKSALLDLVQFACSHSGIPPATRNRAGETTVLLSTCLSEPGLKRVFQEGTSGGPIGGNHWEFGKQFVGKPLIVKLLEGNKKTLGVIEGKKFEPRIQQMLDLAAQFAENPLEGKLFKRLSAGSRCVFYKYSCTPTPR
jgi:putative ATP-dependent endonuclease of the OLD family